MPITVLTGMPGNGKTLLMMEMLHAAAAKAERPLFVGGVDGLQPGLAAEIIDPRKWNEISDATQGPCTCGALGGPIVGEHMPHTHVIPDGALIFIDEAWKWFGHLHDARNQPTPPHVLGLAEHRHRGIDFVWTTQMPNQLYPFVRGLIADHYHVVRRFGTRWIDVYKWGELNDDVKSQGKRDVALRESRTLPVEKFGGSYKSATQHTIKANLPWKIWLLPACLVAGVALCWMAYLALRPSAMTETIVGKGTDAPLGAAAPQPTDRPVNGKSAPVYATAVEYVTAHMPRLAALPWSAPVFDKRGITADPELFCMSSGEGLDANGDWKAASCSCKTEQSTEYDLPSGQCEYVAQHGGHYNPYKQRDRSPASSRVSDQRASMAQSAAPLSATAAIGSAGQGGASYGQIETPPIPANVASAGL